jgi:hypothetical protein
LLARRGSAPMTSSSSARRSAGRARIERCCLASNFTNLPPAVRGARCFPPAGGARDRCLRSTRPRPLTCRPTPGRG